MGNTSSASPQAGPGEMGLLPLLGLIWQPLTDVHYIKLPEWSQREVVFLAVPFKGEEISAWDSGLQLVFSRKKKGNIKIA